MDRFARLHPDHRGQFALSFEPVLDVVAMLRTVLEESFVSPALDFVAQDLRRFRTRMSRRFRSSLNSKPRAGRLFDEFRRHGTLGKTGDVLCNER